MHRVEINVQTGEKREIPLTPQEIEEISNRPAPEEPQAATPLEKLESVGLTVADLKDLLGLSS